MNTKLIKGVAALVCVTVALGMTFRTDSGGASSTADAAVAEKDAKDLMITEPMKESDYGIGTYRIEGYVPKDVDVEVFVDRKEFKTVKSNAEDGSYDVEFEVTESGDHTVLITYLDASKNKVTKKLEFTASSEKNASDVVASDESANNEPVVDETASNEAANAEMANKEELSLLPNNNGEDVYIPDNNEAANEEPKKSVKAVVPPKKDPSKAVTPPKKDPKKVPSKVVAPPKKGVVPPKKAVVPPKKAVKPPKKPVAPAFTISSHATFNTVNHGVVQIGGRGIPGNKVILLVDGKPAMRGTVKADGKWKFPVKLAIPGFRVIAAQDLRTRTKKTIKLKIK